MSNSLYKISENYLEIINEIELNEGEITPELEEQLLITQQELVEKSINYVKIVKMLEGDVQLANNEIERINKFKEKKEKIIDKMKSLLLFAVLNFGEEGKPTVSKVTGKEYRPRSLELGTFKLSVGRHPKVEIVYEDDIDIKYVDYNVSIKKLNREKLEELKEILKNKGFTLDETSSISKTKIKEDFNPENKGEIIHNDEVVAYFNEENYSLKIL